MTIEITDIRVVDRGLGTVRLTAINVSEENLQRFERYRDDGIEQEICFEWNTKDSRQFYALRRWLKSQKALQDCKTYKDVFSEIVGLIVESPSYKYRVYEW